MDGSSSKETSCRRSCREGNTPQPLEVASLLKLAATNVLFPKVSHFERRTRGPEPNFESWLHFTVEMPTPGGSNLTINMLRSEEWLRSQIGFVVA